MSSVGDGSSERELFTAADYALYFDEMLCEPFLELTLAVHMITGTRPRPETAGDPADRVYPEDGETP